jgi:hypothetical protein
MTGQFFQYAKYISYLIFAKALLPKADSNIPKPSTISVNGQGKGQPKSGLGIRAAIKTASNISNKLP